MIFISVNNIISNEAIMVSHFVVAANNGDIYGSLLAAYYVKSATLPYFPVLVYGKEDESTPRV